MSSEKRQRQRENRMRASAQAQRRSQRSRRTRKGLRFALIVAAVLVALLLYTLFSGGDDNDETTTTTVPEADAAPADSDTGFVTEEPATEPASEPDNEPASEDADEPAAEADAEQSATEADPDAESADPGCPAADGSDGPRSQFAQEPPVCIDIETLYAATFSTAMGDFTMVLDPLLDVTSVNNFVVLGRYGAFDGTLFHRVIADFVIQGGDVELAYGTGGPGYRFTGGFPDEDWYRIGSVAMANAGNPASNGSQFFVITGDHGAALPPLYSPLGHVIDGMDVVLAIESVPIGPRDAPVDEVVVDRVTIAEATESQIAAYEDARS
ncbi:peptidylprolyl isomerase [Candidatus Poriferisodalis sp.]|uniref:peptidylprolyl isomerase n=1 Tax=Candidatus Poriferisodalis sp. TaxID=3101277 RepID=UPI003B017841